MLAVAHVAKTRLKCLLHTCCRQQVIGEWGMRGD